MIENTPQIKLKNTFLSDVFIQNYVHKFFPKQIQKKIIDELEDFGGKVIGDVLQWAEDCEQNPPYHVPYSFWKKKIDRITVSPSWHKLKNFSASEGLIAIPYEAKLQEYSRCLQFLKLYLFNPSSAFYTCPLAMTDGGAKLIQVYGDEKLKKYFLKIISRNPKEFISSGQWMTEKAGGSDVRFGTQTVAKKENGEWRLYGEKWFASEIIASTAFTLAKIEDSHSEKASSNPDLSLFFVKIKNDAGQWNNIEVDKLKDKLGTRALPTAEIKLNGTLAHLVGEPGNGIKKIATLFNITRIHNSITACALGKRLHDMSLSYAEQRMAFGKKLSDLPLHKQMLCSTRKKNEDNFYFTMHLSYLLGLQENNKATEEQIKLLRLLTPICKLYTAKENLYVVSELLESFGGIGYIETDGIPRFLRDSQVLTIWEGTTHVLSLDMLRALTKDHSYSAFVTEIHCILNTIEDDLEEKRSVLKKLEQLTLYTQDLFKQEKEQIELQSKNLAYRIAKILIQSLRIQFQSSQKYPTQTQTP